MLLANTNMVLQLIDTNSFIGWIFFTVLPSMYLYRKVNIELHKKEHHASDNIRIISTFHALAASSLSIFYLNGWIHRGLFSWAIGFISYGFFLIDFSHILLYKHQYSKNLLYSYYLHHSLVLLALSYTNYYPYMVARAYLSELTTPFINLSWLLHKCGSRNNYYLSNAVVVLLLFIFARIYNIYHLLSYPSPETTGLSNIILSLLLMLNIGWTYGLSLIYYKDFKHFLNRLK